MKNEANKKHSLKNKRVKSFFIQAAKEIIISEGVENLSVRKVADRAGYTFATIYNYFKDVNELLQEVKAEMIQDVMESIQGKATDEIFDLEDIKRGNRIYVDYYIMHPNVFHFFYSYRFNPVSTEPHKLPDFEEIWKKTYQGFVLNGIIQESQISVISKTIIYSLHGLLALYFSDNGMTIENLYYDLDSITDHLLKERKK